MVRAALSDGLLFTLPPPGLTVSTCKGQDQRTLSWCVFTRLAGSERKPTTGEMRPRGPVPITNTLAVLLNPPRRRESPKSRQNRCIWSLSPRCCLITEIISQSFLFWKAGTVPSAAELQLWLDPSPQPSGEVAGRNLFSHRLGLQAASKTLDKWWSAGARQRCFIVRIMTSI